MSPPQLYRVQERFSTWQGEGIHMGRPAFFIRLYGCPVKCPWCDSAGTWHPNYVPKEILQMTAAQLAEEAKVSGAPFAVITGGEPTIFDLTELLRALQDVGMRTHLETSGAFEIKKWVHVDWITLSPKKWKLPISGNVVIANEFKFIIETPEDIDYYWKVVTERGLQTLAGEWQEPIWLHPEWSLVTKGKAGSVLEAITNAVKRNDRPFRAGWQLHKLYKADQMDARSAWQVPLGGDPSRGF